jgi:hypothetical protein
MAANPLRSQKRHSDKRRTVKLTLWVEPGVKERLAALAAGKRDRKLATLSGLGTAFLKRGMATDPDKPYGPSLEPVVRGAIDKGFVRHDNRLAPLQARDTRDSAQTLHLQVQTIALLLQILDKLEPVAPGAFERIIAESEKRGREALTQPDPLLLALVRDRYLHSDGKGEH